MSLRESPLPRMHCCRNVLVALFLFTFVGLAQTPPDARRSFVDAYISTGDNHFLGSSLPIDSPASIETAFDFLQKVNGVRRVYWRGLQMTTWLETMQERPENCRYLSFWQWARQLYQEVEPDKLAVKAAHARGMEIWGVGTLFDWGSEADTPLFADYPFWAESRLRLEHPEWIPVDKHGVRKQGGPIELAYPEARRALVDLHVRKVLETGYDGMVFLTYVENFDQRFLDEFGYSEPIVQEFQRRHKIDIRTQNFTTAGSRQDWIRLRGEYITAYLRELKAELAKYGKKLGVILNSMDPHQPQTWAAAGTIMPTAGPHYLDLETWVQEGIVDNLIVYGATNANIQKKAVEDCLWLTRQTHTQVDMLTSSPLAPGWESLRQRGVSTILAVNDDEAYLSRSRIPEQPLTSLGSGDPVLRMRILGQIVAGKTKATVADVAPLATDSNLIVRRLALQALGKTKDPESLSYLTKGLEDSENGVRCMAALAIGEAHDARAVQPLLRAVERHGNHMLVECAIIALRRMQQFPTEEIAKAATESSDATIRMVAMRALIPSARKELLPVLTSGLNDSDRYTRFAAAEALGNIRRSPEAAEVLLGALDHEDVVVANRAATSLGLIASRQEPEITILRSRLLTALEGAFRSRADARRADADWGYRSVGNALRAFVPGGENVLRTIRDQREDPALAELAWRVLDLPQQANTFSEVTAKGNDAAHRLRPLLKQTRSRALHVDPARGDDSHDGAAKPVRTIARAIRLAQPGDTIHLAPGTYFESADFTNKSGEPGRRIMLDGHGAVLDGSEPVRAADWEALDNGLFRKVKLLPRMDAAILGRWYFLWNGRMNHMGRTSKGPSKPLKSPSDLQPGEWTYVKDEDAFYVRIEPMQSLDAANLCYPLRSSGVILNGECAHITVRNVIATHVYNDGYNIHGNVRDSVFENIAAIDCGDDGVSAHETAECRIDGFVSIGNSTGLCDTVSSVTHYKNVFIKECLGYDIFFIGDSPHSMENALVESSAARSFEVSQHVDRPQDGTSSVTLRNVLFRRAGGRRGEFRITRNSSVKMEHCTFLGTHLTVTPGGMISLRNSVFSGDPKPEVLLFANTLWGGDNNLFDLASLRVDKTSFTSDTFGAFQKLTGTDSNSRWVSAPDSTGDIGADEASLQALEKHASKLLQQVRGDAKQSTPANTPALSLKE